MFGRATKKHLFYQNSWLFQQNSWQDKQAYTGHVFIQVSWLRTATFPKYWNSRPIRRSSVCQRNTLVFYNVLVGCDPVYLPGRTPWSGDFAPGGRSSGYQQGRQEDPGQRRTLWPVLPVSCGRSLYPGYKEIER